MKKRNLILIGLAVIIFAVGLYFIIGSNSGNKITVSSDKQLYTCGMHPDVISEEPGRLSNMRNEISTDEKHCIKK